MPKTSDNNDWIIIQDLIDTIMRDMYEVVETDRQILKLREILEKHITTPSISPDAVRALREKRGNGKHKPVTTENGWELVGEINNDLDQLLSSTKTDDTN